MKKIPSFTIDHIRLLRGIYVSRKDEVNGEVITTFDIRMKEPNREPALGQGALHTIEHLAATYLRNEPQWQDKIIYWGPMGCLTGNYLLMKGDLQPQDIVPLMQDMFRFVAGYEGEVFRDPQRNLAGQQILIFIIYFCNTNGDPSISQDQIQCPLPPACILLFHIIHRE